MANQNIQEAEQPKNVQQAVQTQPKPVSFQEMIKTQIFGIESNKKFILDFFAKQGETNKIFKVFVVRSEDKKRENYYEIFFDFGALGNFAQKQKNLSSNQDADLLDSKKVSKDYFKKLYYEIFHISCVDINDGIFDFEKTNGKTMLETMTALKPR